MAIAIGHGRPGRPREFDMNHVLDQAIGLFCEQGFHATSIATLSDVTGLTVGSIYKAFKDKEALFSAAIERYTQSRSRQLQNRLSSAETGYDRVHEMVSFYAQSSQNVEGERGCLIVTAAADISTFDEKTANQVKAALEQIEDRLRDFICQGQEDGSIAKTVDAETSARLFLCLLQGMRVVGKKGLSKNEITPVADQIMTLLA